ncbi:MAG: alcohol dehydrogenase [Omnitrophica WOR_2 bacterium RIFCSPLOWO2_12_FULL_46_30]|nr:MAG: alcohol dehydrogenase [Omnitrophica WOR_2 bacterium RIFCSPHIGHO2_02_FULL_46_37]OGX43419.1 MAG: alcohol dehydrogenase [Omnitrophica WOR_2 bacterium RIFCSPLOWO2_02_FULL_45_28]OGX51733.1 MAG: alcohol dehydrogenase [Omnitrophica WOR_2 bacterium RIFCSPLOWO2_12_FULL_46_30]
MRVGMYYNNRDVRVEEMPKPKIGPGEFLLKVRASGICGSDVMEWYRIKKAPLVLGHEATGEIAEVGEGVKNYKIGDRVFVAHHIPCNTCRYCLSGEHTACETLQSTNYYPGGFAEYIRVPALNVLRGALLLPPEVSFEEGTFIEPLACVLRGQRMARLKAKQSVLILGSGISGLLHLLLARTSGAQRIIMTDINKYRLKVASELGADSVINANEDVIALFRKNNEGRLADLVVVCSSATPAFQQALELVERAGTILCFAPTLPGVKLEVPVADFWRNNIKIIHSYGSSPEDAGAALELLRAKRITVTGLITHRLKLSQIGEGFRIMLEGKDSIKVIIEPNS